jgi:hypothetical protein
VLPGLALVAALIGLVIQARLAPPVAASTKAMWMAREKWAGKTVETVGELKEFEAGTPDDHYALENDGYRVGVRGIPAPVLAPLLGRRVRARGVFVFTEKAGGYLDAPVLTAEKP